MFFFHIIKRGMFMRLFSYLDRYLIDKEYKITISSDKVHIINYLEVEDFSDTRVVVRYEGGVSILLGKNLVVSKMQDEELLITGKLNSIQV